MMKAFALLGPTACGKTALALKLAEYIPCEIISLDSALIYRNMDIGTAKPSAAEQSAVAHHLIDIISPLQTYSAAEFVSDCVRLVQDIRARGKLPLIVGGTMMYYHALTQGLNQLPEADEATRSLLQRQKAEYGLPHLYRQLQQIDSATAARLDPNDSQRIERALEVWLLTGKPLSRHFAEQQHTASPLQLFTLALVPDDRVLLHERINRRFDAMLAQGFLDEVHRLRRDYPQLNADMPSVRCVGYRQAWAYLDGETDEKTFVEQGKAATRQLAKRQLTWLRKLHADKVLNPFGKDDMLHAAVTLARDFFQAA